MRDINSGGLFVRRIGIPIDWDIQIGSAGRRVLNRFGRLELLVETTLVIFPEKFAEALGVAGGSGLLREIPCQLPWKVLHDAQVLQVSKCFVINMV